MGSAERIGRAICLVVMALFLLQCVGWAVNMFVTAAPAGEEGRIKGMGLLLLVYAVVGVTTLYRGIWGGVPASRWLGFVAVAGLGAVLIWLADWQTTLDFPNAVDADARNRMQADSRAAKPWVTAWGAVNVAAGALMLLPQVGQFIRARREGRVPNEAPPRPVGV
jgi:hypothetical protein